MLSIENIGEKTLLRVDRVDELKNILKTVLRSCKGSITDELALEMIT
jgi:hypothetical protein